MMHSAHAEPTSVRPASRSFTSATAIAACVPLTALLTAMPAFALIGASSTTTTTFAGTTSTTFFVPVDVTGGGTFEGSFPKGSFDTYSFDITEPRVLVAETDNGFGGCPGDTIVELRRPGAPGKCNGVYGDNLPCIAFDDDSGISLCSKLVHYIAEPGTYEIRVSAYGGAKLNRYFLHVQFVEVECGNGEKELSEDCDDGNLASGDCCSSTCHKEPAGTACDDGLGCNGADTCDASASCSQHAGNTCPGNDGDANCAESCSDSASGCTNPDPNGSPCDDGIFCNGADTCSGGSCSVHEGSPCPGPDNDNDCSETCNEQLHACNSPDPNGSACDDVDACTGPSTCNASGTCVAGAPLDCDDHNSCTTDQCISIQVGCQNTPIPDCVPAFVCGDANGDGTVKASDALAVLKDAVGGDQCAARPCVCDANGSGTLTAADALAVLKAAVGAPVTLACPC